MEITGLVTFTPMKFYLFLLINIFAISAKAQVNPNAIVGNWIDTVSQNRFEIAKVENTYSIKIIGLKSPLNDKGLPKTDVRNPDESLRNRQIMGMKIASGIVFNTRTKSWNGEEIYSPEKGMTASCTIVMSDANHLELVATKYFIKVVKNWKRYDK